MNQHFISQFIIKNWLQEDEDYLNIYDIQKDIFIDKNSKNPLTSKGVFSSNQITEHNKIFNEISEKKIKESKIEDDAEKIIKLIINGEIPQKNEMNRLGKYFQLFSLLSSSYYWQNKKINESKLNQYVNDIINLDNKNINFLIMEKKSHDDDIVLSINAFLCKYGNVAIYTISPDIIIALGDELTNTKVELSSNKLAFFNSDFAKIGLDQENNILLFPYIVFRNNSQESIKKLLLKPQQGLKCILRIDEEQACEAKQQGKEWNKGEYLLLLGERGMLPFSKYF